MKSWSAALQIGQKLHFPPSIWDSTVDGTIFLRILTQTLSWRLRSTIHELEDTLCYPFWKRWTTNHPQSANPGVPPVMSMCCCRDVSTRTGLKHPDPWGAQDFPPPDEVLSCSLQPKKFPLCRLVLCILSSTHLAIHFSKRKKQLTKQLQNKTSVLHFL